MGGTDVKQKSTLTEGQQKLLDQLTGILGGQVGQGVQSYPGNTVAGVSPLQQQGMGAVSGGLTGFQNFMGGYNPNAGQTYLNQAQPALNTMLADYDPSAAKDYWNQTFVNPSMQNWQENILPGVKEQFASANAADSGMMNRAIAQSGRNLSTDLNAQLANILYSGSEAQKSRQQTGINQAMDFAQMPGAFAQQYGQLQGLGSDLATQAVNTGGIQQQYEQNKLNEALQKWQQSQPYNNPWLQNYLAPALGTPAFENVAMQQPMGLGSSALLGGISAAGNYFGMKAPR